jgi:putative transposase
MLFQFIVEETTVGMNEEREHLSDEQWERIKATWLFVRGKCPGARGKDNRLFFEAIFWLMRTGSPWRDLPEKFGNWNTVYKRFREWVINGLWKRIFEKLKEEPDFEWFMIDSTIVRAHQHSAGAKKGILTNLKTMP